MSLLQNLQNKRASLRHSDTLVTQADGTRYLETHSSLTSKIPLETTLGFVVDSAPDEIPAQVIPHLYIGSQDCCTPQPMFKHGIRTVLSIGIEAPHRLPNVNYFFIECLDLPDTKLTPISDQCNEIIRNNINNGDNILVHCNAGVSRSSAVVIAFLIREWSLSYEEAYNLLKSVRPSIQPNAGFINQLKHF